MNRAVDSAGNSTLARQRAGKYLTFYLEGEEYGLEILKVHEIIGIMPITRVPRTPPFILGVINLRGKVISIMDLRARFGMRAAEQVAEACIIVVQVGGVQIGLFVDRVSEVLDIPEDEIEDAPSFSVEIDTDYILGVAKSNGRVKLLLDIDRVLAQTPPVDATGKGANDQARAAHS